jgi:VIT1/CCC1 family predicted Fe2+/Mn2+ transporter
MTEALAADVEPHEGEPHEGEAHGQGIGARLNWLRAGVLGANDGIVSTAGIVIGVAAATANRGTIATAGIAGLAAGAMSMAVGEYVSVSTQRDTEKALLAKEKGELRDMPEAELDELRQIYQDKGLAPDLAAEVARQLTDHDALGAHAEAELGIDPDELTNPWHAAIASMVSFTLGALLPLVAILLPPVAARIWVTAAAVVIALALTGWGSSRLGEAPTRPAVLRNVAGGVLAMLVTYGIGALVGTQV